jgi:hypothetical protein
MKRLLIVALLLLASLSDAQYYFTLDSIYTRYKVNKPHAQWQINNGSFLIPIAVAGTYVWVTNVTHNMFTVKEAANGIVMQGDSIIINRKIAITVVGNFVITGGANDDFRFRMSVNGVPSDLGPMSQSTGGAGVFFTAASAAYAECDSGTVIKFEVTNTNDTDDPTIRDATLVLTTEYKR